MLLIRIEGKRSGGYNDEYDNHTQFLEKSFSQHIDNLDAHVERIEKRVEFLCRCMNRIPGKRGDGSAVSQGNERTVPLYLFIHVFMYSCTCIHVFIHIHIHIHASVFMRPSVFMHKQRRLSKAWLRKLIPSWCIYYWASCLLLPLLQAFMSFLKKPGKLIESIRKSLKRKRNKILWLSY